MWTNYSQTAQALSVAPSFSFNALLNINAMKKCTKCKAEKQNSDFGLDNRRLDKLNPWCKQCTSKYTTKYWQTKNGIITVIYGSQNGNALKKDISIPNYTKEELRVWLLSQDCFHRLYYQWVLSGFKKDLKPSCDRLDDYKGYTLDNLRLITWGENRYRYYKDAKNGINNKANKAVSQYNLDGIFITDYHSISDAARKNNIGSSNISAVCLGKRNKTAGFIWKFKS